MNMNPLKIEILSGPLDGALIELNTETELSSTGAGPLHFPWDAGLGKPQARLFPKESSWEIESYKSPHGTYRFAEHEAQRIEGVLSINKNNVIKTSMTWLRAYSLSMDNR